MKKSKFDFNIVSNEIPDIFYALKNKFGIEWSNVIISYYPKIYSKNSFNEIKMIHELTHLKQQEDYGVKEWWARYLQDDTFRLEQELEAYRNETIFILENVTDRNESYKLRSTICHDLSSPMYGNLISLEEARKLLG